MPTTTLGEILSEIRALVIEFERIERCSESPCMEEWRRAWVRESLRRGYVRACSEYFSVLEDCHEYGARPRDYCRVFENDRERVVVVFHIYELGRVKELLRKTEKPMKVYLFSLEESISLEDILWRPVERGVIPEEMMEGYRRMFG